MEPEDPPVRRYTEPPRSSWTHLTRHSFGQFAYGLIRGLATLVAFGAAFNYSILLLDHPSLGLEASFRLTCGVVAGMTAYGLSAWLAKPFVPNMSKKWWAPWSYESGYGVDAFIVIIGLVCAFVVMAVASTVGIVSLE